MTHELGPLPEISYLGDDRSYGYDACDMRDYAAAEVARAVEAERERCAMLCEGYTDPADGPDSAIDTWNVAQALAAAIRAQAHGQTPGSQG